MNIEKGDIVSWNGVNGPLTGKVIDTDRRGFILVQMSSGRNMLLSEDTIRKED